jgi:surface antigen/uncharacterized protein YoxC
MLKELTPAERARVAGTLLLSVGLFVLAVAMAYFAYQLGRVREELPALLAQVESTARKVEPVLHEVDALRELVPSILKEVKATSEVVAATVAETAELRKALPPMIDTSAAAINNASAALRAVEPHIPAVLKEVKQTREALPGILDRADQVAGHAQAMGKAAGKGAVSGLLGGIVTAPFSLIGDAGRNLGDVIGLGGASDFTAADNQLTSSATDAVLKKGTVGAQQSWKNPDNGNHGTVTLATIAVRNGQVCATLRYRVEFRFRKNHEVDVDLCRQADGSWVKKESS